MAEPVDLLRIIERQNKCQISFKMRLTCLTRKREESEYVRHMSDRV